MRFRISLFICRGIIFARFFVSFGIYLFFYFSAVLIFGKRGLSVILIYTRVVLASLSFLVKIFSAVFTRAVEGFFKCYGSCLGICLFSVFAFLYFRFSTNSSGVLTPTFYPVNPDTAVEDVVTDQRRRQIICTPDGKIYIIVGEDRYTILGEKL
jgi:hypothetical protein